jgi:DNA-directed RNA polymerase specialized sigma subunit
MFISREEKERSVIDLYYNQGKTIRDIAKELNVAKCNNGYTKERRRKKQ